MIAAPCAAAQQLPLKPEGHDGGRDAELRGRDQRGRDALALRAAARTWAATLRTTRATVRRRIEGWSTSAPSSSRAPRTTKKSGTKNPSASAADLGEQPLGRTERGHEQAGAEPRDEHAGAALLRDPGQREEDEQGEAQVQRPAAFLRALAQAAASTPAGRPSERRGRRRRHRRRRTRPPSAAWATPPGLEHQRDREDRDDVGDRDLPDHRQRLRAGQARLGDHRQHRGGRARAEDDGVDRGVAGAGERRRGQASERRQQQHDARGDRAAAQRGGQRAGRAAGRARRR